jgi:rhomboid family GlyGly-CTERM serine protease
VPGVVRWWRQEGVVATTLAALSGLLWLSGPAAVQALRYERSALANAELWRVLTGNLVHADGRHLLLNLAGLALVTLLFPGEYSRRQWSIVALVSSIAIAAGLWWGNPDVAWYVGLSGVLHGLLAAGVLAWWRSGFRGLALLLASILLVKLVAEQRFGALGWSGDLVVIVDAHLYGALGGACAGLVLARSRRRRGAELPPGASGPV